MKHPMFVVILTKRNTFAEGIVYVSPDLADCQAMAKSFIRDFKKKFIRAWVRPVDITEEDAAAFWSQVGYNDGVEGVKDHPIVPKQFADLYWENFNRGRINSLTPKVSK